MNLKDRAVAALLALFLAAASLSVLAAAPASATVTSNTPVTTDAFTSVSCPTATYCLAGDANGFLWSDVAGTWSSLGSPDGSSITSVTCVSALFCMAGDVNGNTYVISGNAVASASEPDGSAIDGISCASTSFCMVVTAGDVAYTTTNEGTTWLGSALFGGAPVVTVTCPAATLCVVVAVSGFTFTYDNGAWSGVDLPTPDELVAVTCPTVSFCATVDSQGDVFTYDGTSWTSSPQNPVATTAVSLTCPTASLCVLGDASGNIYADNDGTWTADPTNPIDSAGALLAISCSSASSCVAADGSGNALAYEPQVAPSTPTIANAPGSAEMGQSFTPSITTNSDGTTTVVDTTPSVCSLTGSLVQFLSLGTCDLQASSVATAAYLAGTGVVQPITVVSAPKILLPQSALAITTTSGTAGIPLALTTSGGTGGGAITFQIVATGSAGCGLSAAGVLTATSAGSCTVTATKAGSGSFGAATSLPTQVSFTAAPTSLPPPTKRPRVTIRIVGIFANGSSVVSRSISRALDLLALDARRDGDRRMVIIGYAPAPRSAPHNRALSLARARHAAAALRSVFATAHYTIAIISRGGGVRAASSPAAGRVVKVILQ
ncbi:MAG TPA: hypothetical protein VGP11_05560 [Acidimicrobiales bacterium]|jgi:outer membrane protein OmpA-like peptidoglycan-associated protein|nr:hypothetical protein [Acidimicrobiales bacterium]